MKKKSYILLSKIPFFGGCGKRWFSELEFKVLPFLNLVS